MYVCMYMQKLNFTQIITHVLTSDNGYSE